MSELFLQDLLGARVLGRGNEVVGRIEESWRKSMATNFSSSNITSGPLRFLRAWLRPHSPVPSSGLSVFAQVTDWLFLGTNSIFRTPLHRSCFVTRGN